MSYEMRGCHPRGGGELGGRIKLIKFSLLKTLLLVLDESDAVLPQAYIIKHSKSYICCGKLVCYGKHSYLDYVLT